MHFSGLVETAFLLPIFCIFVPLYALVDLLSSQFFDEKYGRVDKIAFKKSIERNSQMPAFSRPAAGQRRCVLGL